MDATHLFFGRVGKLVRVSEGGGGAVEVLGNEGPKALRLDDRRVYMVPSLGECRIFSVPKTGGEAVAVDRCSYFSSDTAMAVDDAWVYWEGEEQSLRRAPKTGGTVQHGGWGSREPRARGTGRHAPVVLSPGLSGFEPQGPRSDEILRPVLRTSGWRWMVRTRTGWMRGETGCFRRSL